MYVPCVCVCVFCECGHVCVWCNVCVWMDVCVDVCVNVCGRVWLVCVWVHVCVCVDECVCVCRWIVRNVGWKGLMYCRGRKERRRKCSPGCGIWILFGDHFSIKTEPYCWMTDLRELYKLPISPHFLLYSIHSHERSLYHWWWSPETHLLEKHHLWIAYLLSNSLCDTNP